MSNNSPIPANNGAVVAIYQIIKSSNFLRSGSGTGSSIHELQGGHPGTVCPQSNGTQTAPPRRWNRQHDRPRSHNQQHCKQTPEVHWNETTMAPVQNCPKTILPLLATITQQHRWLRNKTPCDNPPQGGPRDLLHTKTQTAIFFEADKTRIHPQKGCVRLTNRDYQYKGPTYPFEGTNTHFHIPRGT